LEKKFLFVDVTIATQFQDGVVYVRSVEYIRQKRTLRGQMMFFLWRKHSVAVEKICFGYSKERNSEVSVVKRVIVCVKVCSVFLTVVLFLDMDIVRKILACETTDELAELENLYVLNEYEQGLVYERRIEIGTENEQQGLVANLSDSWTPEQRRNFLAEWDDDEPFQMMLNEETLQRSTDELQSGRGEKRSIDEVNEGTSEQVSESNYFTVMKAKQVRVKKFRTTGTDYTVRFTNTFANMELSQYHNQLHEIFESLLNNVIKDVPENDQVRFVLQTPQLEKPIYIPFLSASRLTAERILAQIERVVQSNHEFRLNDSVNVNVIHVEMPQGGTGTKRSEINLEKHLVNKRSIVRVQNEDEICLARALVVSIAKIENDSRYKSIIDHRWPMQKRLAHELHEKASVLIGKCGIDEVKQFQVYLVDYQIKREINGV
jgi:hypothetical protein